MGIDPDAIPNNARLRQGREPRTISPDEAISFAKHKVSERTAVFYHYEVVREALRFGQGSLRRQDVEQAFEKRLPEFLEVGHYRSNAPGHRYTTPEMIQMESDAIATVRAGIGQAKAFQPGFSGAAFRAKHAGKLNEDQLRLVYGVLI